jgi:hypothetical protein
MELSITEFDVKFSTILANMGACVVNYSEQVNKQMKEMKGNMDKLVAENKRLVEKYEPKKKEIVQTP